jgi:hypothetical protein
MGGWKLVGCPTRERQIRWPLQGAERQRRGQPAAVWVGEWQAALGVWVQNSVVVVHAPIHGRRKELLRPIIDVWMILRNLAKPSCVKHSNKKHAPTPRPGRPAGGAPHVRF